MRCGYMALLTSLVPVTGCFPVLSMSERVGRYRWSRVSYSTAGASERGSGEECITEWYRPKIADYLVLGADFRFAENRALIRLFAIWEVSGYTYSYPDRLGNRQTEKFMPWEKEAFSAVIFPQFSYFFSNGFEAELGGLVALGRDYTRFGDPAVGGSLVWSRFRVRY